MKAEHYFTKQPTSSLQPHIFYARLRGSMLTFTTGSGVFSPKKIDLGTQLLIEETVLKPDWDVLDLGCGYGPVGIALAKAEPSARIVMSDVNMRAVKLARLNAKQNKVMLTVRQSNVFEAVPELFDAILLNPPQTAGKKLCEQMITEAKDHLKQNGLLQVVARHQKGGRELEKHMKAVFGNVEERAKQSGYRVYVSKKD